MEQFKAYKLTETPDRKMKAEFVDMTLDDLDPGDVVVRVAYSDVNYKDALAATGKGRILRRASCVGGIDLSGTVVSSTHPGFKKGDGVFGIGTDRVVALACDTPADFVPLLLQGRQRCAELALGVAPDLDQAALVGLADHVRVPAQAMLTQGRENRVAIGRAHLQHDAELLVEQGLQRGFVAPFADLAGR